MLADLLSLPESMGHGVAQYLCPLSIGNTALLGVDTAPCHGPAALLRFVAQFLGQARLADTCFTYQQSALGTALRIKWQRGHCLLVSLGGAQVLFTGAQDLTHDVQFAVTSDQRVLVATTYLYPKSLSRRE